MNKSKIRIVISILVILLITFGCQNNTQEKIEANNITLVSKVWTAFNSIDIESINELYDKANYEFYKNYHIPNSKTFENMLVYKD